MWQRIIRIFQHTAAVLKNTSGGAATTQSASWIKRFKLFKVRCIFI